MIESGRSQGEAAVRWDLGPEGLLRLILVSLGRTAFLSDLDLLRNESLPFDLSIRPIAPTLPTCLIGLIRLIWRI